MVTDKRARKRRVGASPIRARARGVRRAPPSFPFTDSEEEAHRSDPFYFTQGRVPRVLHARGPNRVGLLLLVPGLYMAVGVVLWAAMLAAQGGAGWSGPTVAGMAGASLLAAIQVAAGVRLLRRPS